MEKTSQELLRSVHKNAEMGKLLSNHRIKSFIPGHEKSPNFTEFLSRKHPTGQRR